MDFGALRNLKSNIGSPVNLSSINVLDLFVGTTTTSIFFLSLIIEVKIGGAGRSEFHIM